jgi:hypothetical protein
VSYVYVCGYVTTIVAIMITAAASINVAIDESMASLIPNSITLGLRSECGHLALLASLFRRHG